MPHPAFQPSRVRIAALAWLALAWVVLGSGACRREAPQVAPTPAVSPAAAAPTVATPTATPAPPALAVASAAAPLADPLHGAVPPDDRWPALARVDVLVHVPAPTLDPAACDDAVRPVAAALRAQPGVEQVLVYAAAGHARVLVRFAVGRTPKSAENSVRDVWQAAPPAHTAPPDIAAIARGARARTATLVLAPEGRPQATALVDAWLPALAQLPHATRAHVVGAVRPFITLDLLPPALAQNDLELADVLAALRALTGTATAAKGAHPAAVVVDMVQARLAPVLLPRRTPPGAQPLPPVPLASLVAVVPGVGEPVREARNGQLPVTGWLIDSAWSATLPPLAQAEATWRRAQGPTLPPDVQLRALAVEGAYRFVLTLPPQGVPEPLDALSQRLQRVREHPDLTGMLAIQGIDGVPEKLDVEARGGRAWTVWLQASAADMELVLREVAIRLGAATKDNPNPGPWRVHLLASDHDTALGWLLGTWATAGALLSAPTAGPLSAMVAEVGKPLQSAASVRELTSGPQRHAAPGPFARSNRAAAVGLPPALLHAVLKLTEGPVYMGHWEDLPWWVGLPRGLLGAQQGALPLQSGGPDGEPRLLADVLQLPDTTPVLDRVRVDGRPALWLGAESAGELPDAFSLSFWALVERNVVLAPGMRVDPFVLRDQALGARHEP